MRLPVILAHGVLGSFDELFFVGVAIAFVTIMAISWIRARNLPPNAEETTTPTHENDPLDNRETPDRFKLE